MKNIFKISLVFILLMCSLQVEAQKKKRKKKNGKSKIENTDQGDQIKVELKNGNILIGQLVRIGEDSLIIKNDQFGRVALANQNIEDYSGFINPEKDEMGWNKEKYQAQYFISPSARPVGKGNIYYTNFNIFGNTFSFGVSDNFSINAGFEAISLFAGEVPIMYASPKLSIPIGENFYVGAGTTIFLATFDGSTNIGGLAYANTTIGSATKNFSFGGGFAYSDGETSDELLFQIGFAYPFSKRISLIGEGFFTSDIEGIYNIGLRIITKNNLVFDAGIARPIGFDDGIIGLPLLALSIPF